MEVLTSKYHKTKQSINAESIEIDAAKEDISKFDVLYNRYYAQIFRFIYQRVETEDKAADLASQTFLKAMQKITQFEHKGFPFVSWLYRIAINEVNLDYRKSKRQRYYNANSDDLEKIINETEEEYRSEKMPILLSALQALNKAELELIELRFFEKRPFKEIGEILEMTENNAKVKTFRVIKKLKNIILPISK